MSRHQRDAARQVHPCGKYIRVMTIDSHQSLSRADLYLWCVRVESRRTRDIKDYWDDSQGLPGRLLDA